MVTRLQILCCALSLSALSVSTAAAQLIGIKTAPVSVSEQFYTFPSELLGMGGGYALKDLEADPFGNPATGARINGSIITGTPTFYRLTRNDGFGRTLPVALFSGSGSNFVVFSIAPQELESARMQNVFVPEAAPGMAVGILRNDRFSQNLYASGLVGQKFQKSNSAIALSASYAKIDALHVVDLLYPNAQAIEQGGHVADVRLGYLRELSGDRSFEAVLVRNSVDMNHTVTYVDRVWQQVQPGQPWEMVTRPPRLEYNEDNTVTWGAHVAYQRPMPETRWRLGGALTVNAKTHPHIPNYEFMRIPRDPGSSWAFRLGVGAAHVDEKDTWAFDLSYEPAWTSTWAEAATTLESASGRTIPVGAVTVENEMVFSNTTLHLGYLHHYGANAALQLGMNVQRINYWLDQYSHITEVDRQQDEGWTELTPTWGFTLGFKDFQVRYFGHYRGGGLTLGGSADGDIIMPTPATGGGPDIVAAPSSPLSMDVVPVMIHQLGISIPFGRKPAGSRAIETN
jgi:hypothetical protein